MLLLQSMTCREMFDEIAADYQKQNASQSCKNIQEVEKISKLVC